MDDLLNDVKSLHFPLTQMCLTKMAINICKHQEITYLIQRMPFLQTLEERDSYRKTHEWKRIEQLSVDIISDLSIPEKLKFRIFHTVWPVCMEINLVTCHYFKFLFCGPPLTNIDLQNKLEWTSYGTVDLVRTAKVFMRDEILNVNERYRLACYYCLEDDIPEIWAKVVENYEASLDFESHPRSLWLDQMTLYWACYAKKEPKCSKMFSYKNLFIYASNYSLIEAVKYFFAKLSIEQKRHFALENVNSMIRKFNNLNQFSELKSFRETSDLLFMYFSFLTPSTQQYLLKLNLWAVMLAFAKFPRTSSLMEIPRKYGNSLILNNFSRIALTAFSRCVGEIDSFHHRGLFLAFLSEFPQHLGIDNEDLKVLFTHPRYHLVRLMTFNFPFLLCEKTLQEKREIISQGLNECNFKTNYEFDKESWIFLKRLISKKFSCIKSLIEKDSKFYFIFRDQKKRTNFLNSFNQISEDLI